MEGFKGDICIVGISGIIGVGKSTAVRRLEKSNLIQKGLRDQLLPKSVPSIAFVLEPSDLWREKGWLENYYKNQNLFALPFQMLVYMTHVKAVEDAIAKHKQANRKLIIVVERTMYDQMLFWKLQGDCNFDSASSMHDEAYMMAWKRWNDFLPPIKLILFFNTSEVTMTMDRIEKRNKKAENGGLTLEYQQKLEAKHQEWYTTPVAFPLGTDDLEKGVACQHISADKPYHNDESALAELATTVTQAIIKHLF